MDVRIQGVLQKESMTRARLRDRSGLMAEILLLNFLNKEIRLANLARQANVSTALASRVLTRLAKLKLLDRHGGGPQRFWKMPTLAEFWISGLQKNNPAHKALAYPCGVGHRKNY